jgi:hypothetical protein
METYQLAALLAGYARPDLLAAAADGRGASIPGESTSRVRDRRERRHRVLAVSARRLWA